MKFSLLVILLLLTSCSDYAEIVFKEKNFYLNIDSVKISDFKIEKWHVGPLRRQLVSKGVVALIAFPEIDRDGLDKLVRDYEVNSWIIRIRKRAFSVNTTVGHIYIPLVVPGTQADSKYRRHQLKKAAISLYYPAAAISKRFEYFTCPAFNHDRLVKDIDVENPGGKIDTLFNSVVDKVYMQSPVVEFNYSGNILNAGESITGEYEIDLALYNYKTKERLTNFSTLRQVLVVKDEARVTINGCQGFQIPPNTDDVDKMKMFKFKK